MEVDLNGYSEADAAILRSIQKCIDPDAEPHRPEEEDDDDKSDNENDPDMQMFEEEEDDDDDDNGIIKQLKSDPNAPSNIDSILSDNALRQHLNIGKSFTGPKGVIEDHKFHQKQERARKENKLNSFINKISKPSLSSGWMSRQIKAEGTLKSREEELARKEIEIEEDEQVLVIMEQQLNDETFLNSYRKKRMLQMKLEQSRQKFGSFIELNSDNFVNAIDGESKDTVVLIHIYNEQVEACRLTNHFLTSMARNYIYTKFCKIHSFQIESSQFQDPVVLPAILIYKGGELINTLLRITDEINGWTKFGRCLEEDFEKFILKSVPLEDSLDNFNNNVQTSSSGAGMVRMK